MKAQKYIKVCINYGMPIYDVVCELQELQSHYPELQVCQSTELEFRTPDNEEESLK
jgi:hypothetical protein